MSLFSLRSVKSWARRLMCFPDACSCATSAGWKRYTKPLIAVLLGLWCLDGRTLRKISTTTGICTTTGLRGGLTDTDSHLFKRSGLWKTRRPHKRSIKMQPRHRMLVRDRDAVSKSGDLRESLFRFIDEGIRLETWYSFFWHRRRLGEGLYIKWTLEGSNALHERTV